MKALVFLAVGKVGIVDKPIPDPGPNDAVVKTTASLICTSDVHTVRGVIEIPSGRGLGHESVGVVYKVGKNVTRCKEGDRVAVCAITPCGHCENCQRGFTSQCGGMLGGYKYTTQERAVAESNRGRHFIGSPAAVAAQLHEFLRAVPANELIVTSMIHAPATRLRSYELLAHGVALPVTHDARASDSVLR